MRAANEPFEARVDIILHVMLESFAFARETVWRVNSAGFDDGLFVSCERA